MTRRTVRFAPVAAAALALLTFAPAALGQQPAVDEKRQVIRELVDVMQAEQTVQKTADAMMKQMSEQYPKLLSDLAKERSDLTPEQRDRIQRQTARSFTRFSATFKERLGDVYSSPEFFEKVYYPAYAKYYSESELRHMLVFYRSPTGQKVLHVLPEFTGDILKSTFDVLGPRVEEIVQETLKQELERLKNEKVDAA
jgi:hypothetical protein